MIVFRKNVWSEPGDLEATLQYVLEQQEAMNLGEILACTGFDADAVRQQMQRWSDEGRVRVVRPVNPNPALDEHVFYRWRKESDGACLWQRDYYESVRGQANLHRIDDIRAIERNMP